MEIIPMTLPVNGEFKGQVFEVKDFRDKVALIDADYLKYLVTSVIYKKVMLEGLPHEPSLVYSTIDFFLAKEIFNCFEAKAYVFCFSAPSKQTFRMHVAQEKKYKGNREDKTDSTFYPDKYNDMATVISYIKKRYQILLFEDLEADDLISFLQDPTRTFILSLDKDSKQIAGFHYNRERHVLEYIDEEEGFTTLVKQVMQGDTTDNIPGLKGSGPAAVDKVCGNQVGYPVLISVLNEFVTKKGLLHGVDTFVEMWMLTSMKINRGEYFQEKYASAINIVNELIHK